MTMGTVSLYFGLISRADIEQRLGPGTRLRNTVVDKPLTLHSRPAHSPAQSLPGHSVYLASGTYDHKGTRETIGFVVDRRGGDPMFDRLG